MGIKRLGVDIGGVIIDRVNDGTDTAFHSGNYLQTTAVSGAIATISRLAREQFGTGNVFLVSKCGEKIEEKTRQWLKHRGFYEATGMTEGQVHFCRERSDKAEICKKLGITHFVDDKLEVLWYLEGIVGERYLLNSSSKERFRHRRHLPGVTIVKTWAEIFEKIVK